jgi:hypothetical protein
LTSSAKITFSMTVLLHEGRSESLSPETIQSGISANTLYAGRRNQNRVAKPGAVPCRGYCRPLDVINIIEIIISKLTERPKRMTGCKITKLCN